MRCRLHNKKCKCLECEVNKQTERVEQAIDGLFRRLIKKDFPIIFSDTKDGNVIKQNNKLKLIKGGKK